MFKSKVHTPVFLLGMHRSGTTMVAEALNDAGVYAGALCDHNREPFYAVDLNDRLLEKAGGRWDVVPELEELDRVLSHTFSDLDALALYGAHLKSPYGTWSRLKASYNGPWMVKDPRLTFTLPWWLERFPNAKVIWIRREEPAIVRSLLARQEKVDEVRSALNGDSALALVRAYHAQASNVLKKTGVDYRSVAYEDLVSEDLELQRKKWFSLYQFADVRPGKLEGFTARSKVSKEVLTEPRKSVDVPENGPLVSVIVPNYNHAPFLEERISTIVNQSYSNIEVLLMDDCSPDNSREILEAWAKKDARISLMFNEVNSGSPFAQWEKGATWAKGKYLWIAESDDAAELDMLALHVQALEANEAAVIAYSHSHLVNSEGKFLRDFRADYGFIFGDATKWQRDFTIAGKEEVRAFMIFSNTIPNASGILMRKSAFDKVGAPATTWKLNGDWLFYARLLQEGDLVFFSQARNYFRFHEKTQRSRAIASFEAFDEILAMYTVFEQEKWTDQERLTAARAQVAMWWAGNVFSMKFNTATLTNNIRLYRIFSSYRKGLGLYLLRSAVIKGTGSAVKALGLKAPVKKLAVRLFPKSFFPY